MNPISIPMGPLATNGYFYELNGRIVLIDPGATSEEMERILDEQGKALHGVLLTHGHIDHVMGLSAVRRRFPDVPIHLHTADLPLYQSAGKQAAIFGLPFEELPGDLVPVEGTEVLGFTILHTPGHSPGSVCYYDPGAGVCFSGDTLFNYGVGRTDLWGGSWKELLASIRTKLFALPDETVVYSGHGPRTTIGDERRENPFVNGAAL